jgi:2'-5' RNA ligase
MRRLFFGLGVDPDVGGRVVRSVKSVLEGDFALYGVDDLHMTLAFLGNVEDERVPEIVRSAAVEFRSLHAPELRIGSCGGALPSREEPRALYAGVREQFETAGRLDVLRNRAMQVGLSHGWRPPSSERGRPFLPHVTVARPRNGCAVPEDFWDLGAERAWMPTDVVLFESLAGREEGGDRYRILASWPLYVGAG